MLEKVHRFLKILVYQWLIETSTKQKEHKRTLVLLDRNPIDIEKNHHGIDLVSEKGDQIIAPQDGVVIFSGINGYLGNTLIISHNYNYFTLYGHCDTLLVHERERVLQGDIIATLGESGETTAPHLHFEIWHNDSIIDPRDIINKYGELDVSTE